MHQDASDDINRFILLIHKYTSFLLCHLLILHLTCLVCVNINITAKTHKGCMALIHRNTVCLFAISEHHLTIIFHLPLSKIVPVNKPPNIVE